MLLAFWLGNALCATKARHFRHPNFQKCSERVRLSPNNGFNTWDSYVTTCHFVMRFLQRCFSRTTCSLWSMASRPLSCRDIWCTNMFTVVHGATTPVILWSMVHKHVHCGPWYRHSGSQTNIHRYMHTYIHIRTLTNTHIHIHKFKYMYIHKHANTHMFHVQQVQVDTDSSTYIHTYIQT